MGVFTRQQGMGLAALLMAGSVFFSRFMGLIRDKVISYYHGATLESDIYFASFVIPDFLNYLLAGGYFSITLIPLLAEYFEESEEAGWKFLSAVLTWVLLVAGGLTAIAWLAAPQLATLAAPGFSTEAIGRLSYFLRIILPAQVFFLLGASLTGVLYMRRQFSVPALTPLVYNGCIILSGWLYIEQGMEGFCWGVLLGAFLGSFVMPLVTLMQSGGCSLSITLRHSGVRRFAWLALPLMVGQSIVVLDEQFIRIFGSLTGDGGVSLLNYARRIMQVPVGVVAQAAGVASYPFLAALVAKKAYDEFSSTMKQALANTMLCIIPICIWMAVVSEHIIRLLFEQGGFRPEQTLQATPLLQVMLVAVVFWGIQQIVGRAFYAHKDTVTPAVVGTVGTVLALPAYWFLGKWYGVIGVAAAGTIGVALYTAMLSYVWSRRYGAGALGGVVGSCARSCAVGMPAGAISWWIAGMAYTFWSGNPVLGALFVLALSGSAFGVSYIGIAALLCPSALSPFLTILRRKRAK